MSEMPTIVHTAQGWTVPMLPEMTQIADVPEGSYIVLHLERGGVKAEIIPPATEEMKQSVRESVAKFKDAFAEMKRLGD
jgi:hypothetical protein